MSRTVPPALIVAALAELRKILKRHDAVHATAVLTAGALDELIRESAAARVDTEHLIEQFVKLLERDPNASPTHRPPPMPAAPPGMAPARRLVPPPRKKR